MAPYVIAECGVSHGGNVGRAAEMVFAAKEARCSAVKFQAFHAKCFTGSIPPKQIIDEGELSGDYLLKISETCDDIGIDFFASVFCEHSMKMIEDLGMCKRFKTAGPDVALGMKLQKKTDMAWWASYDPRYLTFNNGYRYPAPAEVVFFCISNYPATVSEYIEHLKPDSPRYGSTTCCRGLSDHTPGYDLIEKVATLSNA